MNTGLSVRLHRAVDYIKSTRCKRREQRTLRYEAVLALLEASALLFLWAVALAALVG